MLDRRKDEEPPRLVAVLSAQHVGRLQQPVAGVAAMSRILIEASRAGVREAVIAADDPGDLVDAVADDLRRAGSPLAVAWIPRDGLAQEIAGRAAGQALVLTGAAIVSGAALERLCASRAPAAVLRDSRGLLAARVACSTVIIGARRPDGRLLDAPSDAEEVTVAASEVIRLDSAAAAGRAVLAATGKPSDGLVSRYVNRPMSRAISGWMLTIPNVRPGHATVLTAAAAVLMLAALVYGGPFALVAGCLMFQVASMIDGVDGEIARATWRSSAKGAALDTGVDMVTNLLFALGLTAAIRRTYGLHAAHVEDLAVAGLLLGVGLMTLLVARGPGGGSFDILKTAYAGRLDRGIGPHVVRLFRTVTSRDFFAFLFAVMAIAGVGWAIPWLLLVGASLWLLFIVCSAPMILTAAPALAKTAPASFEQTPSL